MQALQVVAAGCEVVEGIVHLCVRLKRPRLEEPREPRATERTEDALSRTHSVASPAHLKATANLGARLQLLQRAPQQMESSTKEESVEK